VLETGVYWSGMKFLCLGHEASVLGLHRCSLIVKAHIKVQTYSSVEEWLCYYNYTSLIRYMLITVVARSKTWTVFACSNIAIVGSGPTRGMDVCVTLFCVCFVLCVGSSLATGWSPTSKESYWLCIGLRNWKIKWPRSKGMYSHRKKICYLLKFINNILY
jgi:hypothetical protein